MIQIARYRSPRSPFDPGYGNTPRSHCILHASRLGEHRLTIPLDRGSQPCSRLTCIIKEQPWQREKTMLCIYAVNLWNLDGTYFIQIFYAIYLWHISVPFSFSMSFIRAIYLCNLFVLFMSSCCTIYLYYLCNLAVPFICTIYVI